MASNSLIRRLVQAGAFLLICDGIIGLIKPRWRSLFWRFGPQLPRAATEELADHPKAARTVYLAEAALGILLASRQTSEVE